MHGSGVAFGWALLRQQGGVANVSNQTNFHDTFHLPFRFGTQWLLRRLMIAMMIINGLLVAKEEWRSD